MLETDLREQFEKVFHLFRSKLLFLLGGVGDLVAAGMPPLFSAVFDENPLVFLKKTASYRGEDAFFAVFADDRFVYLDGHLLLSN
jgi:hypothetical protein